MSRIAYVNGSYVRHALATIHVEDRGNLFADAVYEVIAIARGRLIDGDRHLDRLDRSLAALAIDWPCSRAALRHVLAEVIRRNRITVGTVYLQVSRGEAPRNHAFPAPSVRPGLFVTANRKAPPSAELLERGIAVVSAPEMRWGRPDIKTTGLLPNVLAKQKAVEQGAYEAWFVKPDGEVTEGTSTNAWIVTGGTRLITRPLGHDIIAGITRQAVIDCARGANLQVIERPFSIDEAKAASEAFITSTTSFVLPVVAIDGVPVGEGKPGPVALRLNQEYRRRANGTGR